MPDLDPYALAEKEARRFVTRVWHRVVDFGKTYTTVALLKTLGLVVVAAIAAALNFPAVAVVIVVVALLAQTVYSIYTTKLLKAQDGELRWLMLPASVFSNESWKRRSPSKRRRWPSWASARWAAGCARPRPSCARPSRFISTDYDLPRSTLRPPKR